MKADRLALRTIREQYHVLAEGYRQMASDRNRDLEAEEWVEVLIIDIPVIEGFGL